MRLRHRLTRLAALLSSYSILFAAEVQRIPTVLNGIKVELRLLRLDDRKLIDWPDTAVEIVAESSLAGTEWNLAARLATNGIEPDVGAYSLFYQLNPRVAKASEVSHDTNLLLPKVIPGPKLEPFLADGSHLVVLLIHPELQSELSETSQQVQDLAKRFGSSGEQSIVMKQVQDLASWYGHIAAVGRQRKGPPMSPETLIQLRDEAGALSFLLRLHVDQLKPEKLNEADRDQIEAIHKDVEREMRRYDEVMSGAVPDPDLVACCSVTVTIKGDADAKQIERMRVYYTLNGLFHPPPPGPVPGSTPFEKSGSGESPPLLAKNYKFWVVAEGQEDRILSEPIMAQVGLTAKKKTTLELVLLPSSQRAGNSNDKTGK